MMYNWSSIGRHDKEMSACRMGLETSKSAAVEGCAPSRHQRENRYRHHRATAPRHFYGATAGGGRPCK